MERCSRLRLRPKEWMKEMRNTSLNGAAKSFGRKIQIPVTKRAETHFILSLTLTRYLFRSLSLGRQTRSLALLLPKIGQRKPKPICMLIRAIREPLCWLFDRDKHLGVSKWCNKLPQFPHFNRNAKQKHSTLHFTHRTHAQLHCLI